MELCQQTPDLTVICGRNRDFRGGLARRSLTYAILSWYSEAHQNQI